MQECIWSSKQKNTFVIRDSKQRKIIQNIGVENAQKQKQVVTMS
jgi:hypothetical protein